MQSFRQHVAALQDIHALITRVAPLDEVLTAICSMIEKQAEAAMCAIMQAGQNGERLCLIAGTGLPTALRKALHDVPVSEDDCGCAAAAFHRRPITTNDLEHGTPSGVIWSAARKHGVRACWSHPVQSPGGALLGTISVYFTRPCEPEGFQPEQLALAASLLALALGRHRDRRTLIEAEQRHRSLFDENPDAVFSLDRDGKFLTANARVTEIIGYPLEDVLGVHYARFVHPQDLPIADEAFHRAVHGQGQHYELRARDISGKERILDVTSVPAVAGDEVIGAYGIAKDITLERERAHQLRALEQGLDSSINGVVIANAQKPDMPIAYVNARFLEITGYAEHEVLGRNCRFLQGPDTDPEAVSMMRRRLAEGRESHTILRNYRKDGSPFWNEVYISPVRDERGRLTDFVGVQIDISERKAYESRLAYHASHDPLTGLPNRSLLEERLEHDLDLASQAGRLLAVIYVDLDDFKPINDGMGHAAGDKLLREVTRRLQALLKPGDTLARANADEFVILLPNLSREDDAVLLAETILEHLARPHRVQDQQVFLTASIGIATSRSPVNHSSDLIRHADMAMYRAKQRGRNTYEWHTPEITRAVTERMTLRRDLEEAIKLGQFSLHFQPLIEAATGRVRAAEALLRWRHPEKGDISPARFIPVAEVTGQIIPISYWVIREACRACYVLKGLTEPDFRISVNISPVLFHRSSFPQTVERLLDSSSVSADQLELEVTEGVLMENTEKVIDIVRSLRDMGFQVAIDDFGTGYSSLSYLKDLPVTTIKIDRTFIGNVHTAADDAAIVRGVITMAHQLGFEVVAEGVETVDQARYLVRQNCDLLQGYHFAHPMPLDDFRQFLRDTREDGETNDG